MDKKNIHDKFEEISRRFPDKIALLEDDRLNSYANRVAHALSQLGVGEDDLVGIYLDASIEYIFAMLGILKAGAIFIPLNTKFPEKRMKSIIDKVKPKFFITHTIIEVEFCEIYKHKTNGP